MNEEEKTNRDVRRFEIQVAREEIALRYEQTKYVEADIDLFNKLKNMTFDTDLQAKIQEQIDARIHQILGSVTSK